MQNKEFQKRNRDFVKSMKRDSHLRKLSHEWFDSVFNYEYSYHFRWLGLPIIQFPQDIVGLQEIIWKIKPELIIETGIARGGSLIFSASMLQLIGKGSVLGIDIDIRKENKNYRELYGMSSTHAMNKHYGEVANYRTSEGKSILVEDRGPVKNTINNMLGALRSTCTYINAKNIGEIHENSSFIVL